LVSGLARHRFDAILSDTPINSAATVRTFSHPLGECEIVICGARAMAAKYRGRFPESLDGAPFLLPSPVSDMRRSLDRWFDGLPFNPRVVAEFDGNELMKEFGAHGSGLFPLPSIVFDEVRRQHGIELVGRVPNLRLKYYVVTTDRKIKHPATVGIVQTAKSTLLQDGKSPRADDGNLPANRPARVSPTQRLSRAGLKPL
jgi:LysR family transcriptional regulator, transcriptional activator of nhaA